MMARTFAVALLCYFATLCAAIPTLSPRISPPPPNGTIELHHNPTTSQWYLLASLDPSDYTKTKGNKTILGQHNPKSIVTVYFSVNKTSTSGTESNYAIYSDPVAFEHHIDDPLTAVYVYNVIEYAYPEGQPIGIFLDINGTGIVGSQGGGGQGSAFLENFTVDLNYPFNVTGIFTDSSLSPAT